MLWALYESVVQPDEQNVPQGHRVQGLEDLPCYVLGGTFIYWDHESRMPWHTPEFMEGARNDPALKGRESEYLRIWQNRWTTGYEAFIDMEQYDLLCKRGDGEGLWNRMPSVG